MSSPAGQPTLHGGTRSTYTARSVRHEPVLLARLDPTSSVIANGLSMSGSREVGTLVRAGEQPEPGDVVVRPSLDPGHHVLARVVAEQVAEPFLQSEVLLDRHLVPDLRHRGDLSVLRLEDGEDARLLGQSGDPHGVLRRR